MNFSIRRDTAVDRGDEIISFRGELRASDLLALNEHDRYMIDAILAGPKPSVADYVLCLEVIYRSGEDTTG
jgi:hypothetical protein